MKRLFIFAVALVLVGVAFLGTWAADKSGQTVVSWDVGSCWINLTVHGSVNLGTITPTNPVLEDTDGNDVQVRSNCVNGVVLQVKATDSTTPVGFAGDLLADFQWKVADAPSNPNVTDIQDSYTSFSAFGTPMTVAVSSKPAMLTFGMGYKYTADEQDIPGAYSITLEYTATSQ